MNDFVVVGLEFDTFQPDIVIEPERDVEALVEIVFPSRDRKRLQRLHDDIGLFELPTAFVGLELFDGRHVARVAPERALVDPRNNGFDFMVGEVEVAAHGH